MLSRFLLAAETLKLIFLAVLRVVLRRRKKLTIYQHLHPSTPQAVSKTQHKRLKHHFLRAYAAFTSRRQIEDNLQIPGSGRRADTAGARTHARRTSVTRGTRPAKTP